MGYYPVLIRLEGLTVLVVGGGRVAERKVESLLEAGAKVEIVARELTEGLQSLVKEGKIKHLGDFFCADFIDSAILVIAATSDKELNHRVSEAASARKVLVNAVDQPEDCTFIVPSVMRRGDLIVAVSTSGKSPALSRKLRKLLNSSFGEGYERFLTLMGGLRRRVIGLGLTQEENSAIFHALVESDLLDALAAKDNARAVAILDDILPPGVTYKDIIS